MHSHNEESAAFTDDSTMVKLVKDGGKHADLSTFLESQTAAQRSELFLGVFPQSIPEVGPIRLLFCMLVCASFAR